jgi:flagellar hook-associated protein FlgK
LQLTANDSEVMFSYVHQMDASVEKLRLLAESLTKIRMQADKEIALAVEVVNEGLFKIGELTNKRLFLKTDPQHNQEALNDVNNEIDTQLANIAKVIDTKYHYSNRNLVISTSNGVNIFDGDIEYQLDFHSTRKKEDYFQHYRYQMARI